MTYFLKDIAEIERARSGKIYPKGTSLVQISATRGQVVYLEEDSEVEAHYATIIPAIDCEPRFLNLSIERAIPEFTRAYQTGLNIQIGAFDFMKVQLPHIRTQRVAVKFIKLFDLQFKRAELQIQLEKDVKKNMLHHMFP